MQNQSNILLFEGGFRVFFLSAALYAALTMLFWSAEMAGLIDFLPTVIEMPLSLWHAHELVFGFIVAVVAGFLTTAVPVWTGTPRIHGNELKFLFLVWLVGRLSIWTSVFLPAGFVAFADIAFLPLVAIIIAKPILAKKLWRNLGFIPLLLLIMLGNILFHMELMGWSEDTAGTGIRLSIGLLILITVVIGGRVIPVFTANWLKRQGISASISTPSWIGRATIISCLITVIASIFPLNDLFLGSLNYLTAFLIFLRLAHWKGLKVLSDPIMWILHAGYALMGVGFLCEGLYFTTDFMPEILAQHVFTVGGLGVMVFGMMSRIALGHTGRPLKIHPLITVAYLLIFVSLLGRTLPPFFFPDFYQMGLGIAGASWVLAWLLYLIIYTPILLAPRPDGKEG